MSELTITFIQTSLHWEDPQANLKMLSDKINGINESTDLIVLPEMFSTGFTMNPAPLAEEMNDVTMQWMATKAKEKNCVLTGSIIIRENGAFYNRLIWMRPDNSFEFYDKKHLFRYAKEQDHYASGNAKLIVDLKGWKVCPMVCYDLRFPVWCRNKIKNTGSKIDANYDLLLFVANWPERRNHPWKTLLLARAMENQAYVIGLNRIGKDGNDVYHSGDSAVINPMGELISKTKAKEEKVETITISKDVLDEWRRKFPAWMDSDDFELSR